MPLITDAVNVVNAVGRLGDYLPTQTRLNQAIHEDQAKRDHENNRTTIAERIKQMDSDLKSELSRLATYFSQLPVEKKLYVAAGVALIGANIGALMSAIGLGIAAAESLYLLAGYLLTSHHNSDVARISFVTKATANAELQLDNTIQNVDVMLVNIREVSANFKDIALKTDACNEQFTEQTVKINAQVTTVREVTSRLEETRITIDANNMRLRETNQHIDDTWSEVNTGISNKIHTLEETDTAITEACNGIQQSNTAITTIQASLGQTTQELNHFLNRLKNDSTQRLVVLDGRKQSADELAAAVNKLDERFVETRNILEQASQSSLMVEKTITLSVSERLMNAEVHKTDVKNHKLALEQCELASKRDDELNAKFEALMNKTTRRHPQHQVTFFSTSTEGSEPSNRENSSLTLVK